MICFPFFWLKPSLKLTGPGRRLGWLGLIVWNPQWGVPPLPWWNHWPAVWCFLQYEKPVSSYCVVSSLYCVVLPLLKCVGVVVVVGGATVTGREEEEDEEDEEEEVVMVAVVEVEHERLVGWLAVSGPAGDFRPTIRPCQYCWFGYYSSLNPFPIHFWW